MSNVTTMTGDSDVDADPYYGTPEQAASLLASIRANVRGMPDHVLTDPAVTKQARRLLATLRLSLDLAAERAEPAQPTGEVA